MRGWMTLAVELISFTSGLSEWSASVAVGRMTSGNSPERGDLFALSPGIAEQ